ncbi:MAG: hypothetical protein JNJ57_05245, partial [Saprospiraceae bacterium]|nr:hypothetical protein [Saprospiraceae bacterium]
MQILIFLLLLLPGVTYAQKHDNIWILGYGGGTQSGSNDSNGLSIINFDLAFQMQNNQTCNLNLTGTNSGFCDSLGNLLMVCNGEKVYHGGLNLMINGGGLNATNGYGTAQPQGALTLPWPEHPNLYVLLVVEVKTFSPQLVTGFKLYYNLLNINSDDPVDSEVVVKKQLIIQDSMENGQLSACKHANGRDWWILMPESHSNRYYTFLLDPSGLSLVDTQAVGDVFFAGLGQAVFTPDGSKYLRVNGNDLFEPNHLYLYDFDRCTGKLSNPLHWEYEPGGLGMGCAISHNSRILYAAMNAVKLIQYDLWAPDVESSGVVVGEYDGYIHEQHFYTAFSIAQLAPNGRIYMSTNGSTPFLHVIDHPGRRGAACGFRQRGLHLF